MSDIDERNEPWDTLDYVLLRLRDFFSMVGVVCAVMFIAGWVTK